MKRKEIIVAIVNGFLMGIANLIPGVSGGTFALVLGMYDRLLKAVSSIDLRTVWAFPKWALGGFSSNATQELQEELKRVDFFFLLSVGIGTILSILTGARVIQFCLTEYPGITLAAFIGLIIPSLKVPYKMIQEKSLPVFLMVIPGILLTILPAILLQNKEGSENLFFALCTGLIAICAMILPGISGSYLMLIMGEYGIVIDKLSHITEPSSLVFLSVFGLGCILGLVLFTRLIEYLLVHHKNTTMAFLLGLILGSFYMLWPFKNFEEGKVVVGRNGKVKKDMQIATASNRLPVDAWEFGIMAVAVVIGGGIGVVMNRVEEEVAEES